MRRRLGVLLVSGWITALAGAWPQAALAKPPARLVAERDGVRVFLEAEAGREVLLASDGDKPSRSLGPTGFALGKKRATLVPFLPAAGKAELAGFVELQLTWSFSNGQREQTTTRHFLLRRDAGGVSLACAFDGGSEHAIESGGSRTGASVALVSASPLIFEVRYSTVGIRWSPNRGEPRVETRRYVVPRDGLCRQEP